MSMALIREYLATHPEGANAIDIGAHLGIDRHSISQSLHRMLANGTATRIKESRLRTQSVFVFAGETRKFCFNAYETLSAMQSACRARLMGHHMTEEATV